MAERNARGVASAVRRGAGGATGKTLKRAGSAARGATGAVSGATGTDAVEHAGKQVREAAGGAGGAAGETLKRAGSTARGATGAVSDVTGTDAVEAVGKQAQEAAGGAGAALERAGGGAAQRTVGEELRAIVREAALEVLVPVARRATRQAAMYAVRRAPQLARDTIAPKLGAAIGEAGGPGAFAKGALSSIAGARSEMLEKAGLGGEAEAHPWRERPLPVEESIDVGVPVETAYDWFTEFEEYAEVLSRGETVDERPNERIEWRSTDGVDATAVVTFHRLSDRLTRVMVTYDYRPQGLVEKTSSLFRTAPRGVSADLMRFKAFVEMSEEDTETDEEPEQQAEKPRARSSTRGRADEDE
jgi:uncharacterized membrane protein